MFNKILMMIALILVLSACAGNPVKPSPIATPLETKYLTADGDVYKIDNNADSGDWADAKIAQANTDCWIGVTRNDKIEFPENADAMTIMAVGMIESNRALANAIANKDVTPCPLAANTNDVAIAEEQGKTNRTTIRWQSVPKIATVVGAVAFGVNGQNKNAEIAVAGVNAVGNAAAAGIAGAGNQITINGDGNSSNTTSQSADNGSSVSDSGGFEPNQTASVNDDEFDPDATNQEKCQFWGGEYFFGNDTCSDGNGGTIDVETGELI